MYNIFEDGDDIFSGGSPKRKFFDIVYNANRNLVEKELANFVERMAAMEVLFEEKFGEDYEHTIKQSLLIMSEELENSVASQYIDLTSKILSQNE